MLPKIKKILENFNVKIMKIKKKKYEYINFSNI